MNKEKYFIDLSKCSEEQIKEIEKLTDRKIDECYLSDKLFFYDGKWEASGGYAILKLNLTELTYPDFIKLFEGGEEENTELSFETEYRLEEFRKIQSEYFDENGECYSGIRLSKNIMEQMLTLINQLENELNSNQ